MLDVGGELPGDGAGVRGEGGVGAIRHRQEQVAGGSTTAAHIGMQRLAGRQGDVEAEFRLRRPDRETSAMRR